MSQEDSSTPSAPPSQPPRDPKADGRADLTPEERLQCLKNGLFFPGVMAGVTTFAVFCPLIGVPLVGITMFLGMTAIIFTFQELEAAWSGKTPRR